MKNRALFPAVVLIVLLAVVGGLAVASDVPELLPRRTVAYLRMSDFKGLCDTAMTPSAKKQFVDGMKDTDAGFDAAALDDIEKMLRQIKTLHVCFTGASLDRRMTPDVGLLAVAETEKPVGVDEFLPSVLMKFLRRSGECAGVPLFAFEPVGRRAEGIPVYAASVKNRVFVSTDKALLQSALEAVASGRTGSLATLPEFKEMTRAAQGNGLLLFVSVHDLLSTIESCLGRDHERDELHMFGKFLGFSDTDYAAYTSGSGGTSGTLSILMDSGSQPYKLIAQPAVASDTLSRLPETTVFAFAQQTGDGKTTWNRLTRYGWDCLAKARLNGPTGYAEAMAELSKGLGLDPENAASLIEEIGAFSDGKPENLCFFAKVKDAKKAAELMKQVAAGQAGGGDPDDNDGKTSYDHLGTTIQLARNFCWTVADNCVFITFQKALLEQVIEARKPTAIAATVAENVKALKDNERFRQVKGLLHERCSLLAYCDMERVMTSLSDLRKAPPVFREIIKGLAVGCSMSVKDGVIEIRVAQNKKADLGAILASAVLPAAGNARVEAMKVRSQANLSQIAKAANMWLLKYGDNAKYPPSLQAILDNGVIKEPKVFLHASGGTKLVEGKFISDYESILDRAGFTLTEANTASSTPLAWEKRQFSKDGRNVTYFDSHVEFVSEERFQEIMKEVDKFIADNKPKK